MTSPIQKGFEYVSIHTITGIVIPNVLQLGERRLPKDPR